MAELNDLIYHFSNDGLNINVEIRPLVKCKECKFKPHWDEKTESAVFPIPDRCPCECDDYFYSWVPNDDWFCADGERRDPCSSQDS